MRYVRFDLARWLGALGAAGLLIALLPDVAAACPVCFDARDENRQAFIATTAFMSLLPLGMVAGAGLWIRKRSRALDEQAEGRPAAERDIDEHEV
jgi:hypothetical protein